MSIVHCHVQLLVFLLLKLLGYSTSKGARVTTLLQQTSHHLPPEVALRMLAADGPVDSRRVHDYHIQQREENLLSLDGFSVAG